MAFEIFDINDTTLDFNPIVELKRDKYSRLFLPDEISEIDLFSLLVWKFKHPNGLMSLAVNFQGDANAPFKWDFIFKTNKGNIVQFIRSVTSLELNINIEGVTEKEIVDLINFNLNKYKKEVYETKQMLGNFVLIVNPYDRHKKMADMAEEELKNINSQKPVTVKDPITTKSEMDKYSEEFSKFYIDSDKEALFSMLLVTESAFSVEAYLNLIHAVFMKEEIFNNNNIFQETLRRQWKNKIERLPLSCDYIISKNIDINSPEIKEMQKLFDLRNKIAHSYPDEKDLGVGQMWFFKDFPILENPIPYHSYQLALNNRLPKKSEALAVKTIADNSINYLNNFIDENNRNYFSELASSSPLAYCKNGRVYSAPFSNQIIFSIGLLKDESN
ncbi:MAG: hypothetical protein IT276_15620 [Ignavibacteriaceae bacterium]|nr:hypothetical protein [Ignavibacteriaceae bacterium]